MRVRHKSYGDGIVKNINGSIIEVAFGEVVKKFQFPKAFGMFLTTQDQELQEKVDAANKELTSQQKAVEPKKTWESQSGQSYSSYSGSRGSDYSSSYSANSPLVGDRAQTISLRSREELFEIIGYMSTPGRVSSFEAEVPKDGRDEAFERLFPGQKYRPIETGDTPSGLPNKLGPQFRINFANLRNCPDILRKNMGKGNGSCVGRINKSKFVIDMVQNYGFRFGEWQDRDAIRSIAIKQGYVEAFDRGYSR